MLYGVWGKKEQGQLFRRIYYEGGLQRRLVAKPGIIALAGRRWTGTQRMHNQWDVAGRYWVSARTGGGAWRNWEWLLNGAPGLLDINRN